MNDANQTISVTIAAPTGYLGATVTIDSQADSDTESSTVTDTGFVDGYMAQAGTVILPALNASVTAILKNEATGIAIANAQVNIKLTSISYMFTGLDNLDNIKYAVDSFTTTTDENGVFNFSNLPVDSTFEMNIEGYQNPNSSCKDFNTTSEVNTLNLGDCTTNTITSQDVISPMVTSVSNIIYGNVYRAMLKDGVETNIQINFSENIDSSNIDSDSITVYNNTNQSYITNTTSLSNNILTITLDQAVVDGDEIDINLISSDFKDMAGNTLVLNQASDVAYDSMVNSVLKLQLKKYQDIELK